MDDDDNLVEERRSRAERRARRRRGRLLKKRYPMTLSQTSRGRRERQSEQTDKFAKLTASSPKDQVKGAGDVNYSLNSNTRSKKLVNKLL
jgi:hypothetical protein